jgi:glycosidase
MYKNTYLLLMSFSLLLTMACKSSQQAATTPAIAPSKTVDWSRNLSIYEVNTRQYSKEGTFAAVDADLPRLKKMGVGIVWFMPITPIGEKGRKGAMGSYYAVKDYMAVNPDYGTIEEFTRLVEHAHELGMYVIIDWVGNHTAVDNRLTETNPEWYTKDEKGNFVPPVADWSDVIDLNYDQQELRQYMIEALRFWVKTCDIDGFRVDVAEMVPTDFWVQARQELDKTKKMFWLAEGEKPELHQKAFDATYGWEMHHLLKDVAQGSKNVSDIYKCIDKTAANFPSDAYKLYFTTNHDENSWNGTEKEKFGAGAAAMFVLSATMPMSMPLLYTAQESALDHRLKFFEKDPVDWRDYPLQGFYTALLQLKNRNKALLNGSWGGKMTRLKTSNETATMAYTRQNGADKILVILNLSDKPQDISITGNALKGAYNNIFDEKSKTFGEEEKLSLSPWEYQVWEMK